MVELVVADWPDHRGNLLRTAYFEQVLDASRWEFGWSFDYLTAPESAWPPSARGSLWQELESIEPRVTDDQADVPIIARDFNGKLKVLVASSANDRLVCVDPTTGQLQWEFVAQAPIRLSPTIREGIAYFGSDDGHVRALSISDGKMVWSTRIGPELKQIIGNGRFISPHPIRASVVYHDGNVFACAGLFPSQGVYAVCLNSSDGRIVWRRRLDKSPQGYMLLADDERLVIPEGRATPFMLALKNGQPLESLPSPGGSFCMLTPDAFFAGPGNLPRVESFPLEENYRPRKHEDESVMLPLQGRATAAGNGRIWVATGKQLICYHADRILNQLPEPIAWAVDSTLKQSLIVSGEHGGLRLFVADGSTIQIYKAETGELLHTLTAPGTAQQLVYMAVSGPSAAKASGRATLIATSKSGNVFCWHGYSEDQPITRQPEPFKTPAPSIPGSISEDAEYQAVRKLVDGYLDLLSVATGTILVIGDIEGTLSAAIAVYSDFKVISIIDDEVRCRVLQKRWQLQRIYGHKVAVQYVSGDKPIPYEDELFNAVIETGDSRRESAELMRLVTLGSGRLFQQDQPPQVKVSNERLGFWRHQYGDPSNLAATQDDRLGTAGSYRLKWFGGIGPQPMPDRHLRGQSPLAAVASLVMHGDGILIGVDPANGFERWRVDLPKDSMRYVMPYDCGYSCMTVDGRWLYTCTSDGIWQLNCLTGKREGRIPNPEESPGHSNPELKSGTEFRWGYLAESGGWLFASQMKSTAARYAIDDRAIARERYSDQDYNSGRPLVCSRRLHCMTPTGKERWRYERGVIVNSTISLQVNETESGINHSRTHALNSGRIVFLESTGSDSLAHPTDRIPLATIMQAARLVCLNTENASLQWEIPIDWPDATNILYTQIAENCVVLVTSCSDVQADRASYAIRVYGLQDGRLMWQNSYPHVKDGLYHGEQVHHPVILRQPNGRTLLVAEPYLYELTTGQRTVPNGAAENWSLQRPGHSCGSLSGCGYSLYFRAHNPTVLNLQSSDGGQFTSLSPSRPGCWINMLPAAGQLLIPEASASCVCHYPIQASMAFVPVFDDDARETQQQLDDLLPQVKLEENLN